MPAVSLFCLNAADSVAGAIEAALALRSDDSFRLVRAALQGIAESTAGDGGAEGLLNELDAGLAAAEVRLGIREPERRTMRLSTRVFSPDPAQPPPFDIGVNVPVPRLGDPRHTSVFAALIGVGATDVRETLQRVFGITRPKVLEDLEALGRILGRGSGSGE